MHLPGMEREIMNRRPAVILPARLLLFAIWAISLLLFAGRHMTAPTAASFPGANGRIAFMGVRNANQDIYLIDPFVGGEPQRLTDHPAYDYSPAWSADGKRIAFTSTRDGNYEIYVMNQDGSDQVNLSRNGSVDYDPVWSPDGSKIAFVSNRNDENLNIYVMNADGSGQLNLTRTSGLVQNSAPSWSPDGTHIAFGTNRDGNWEVYTMQAATGGDLQNLTNSPGTTDSGPEYSPDGGTIAFKRDSGPPYEVYTMDTAGSSQKRLTFNEINEGSLSWSPDGLWIAFTNALDIFMMPSVGGNPINVTNGSILSDNPAWGPIATGGITMKKVVIGQPLPVGEEWQFSSPHHTLLWLPGAGGSEYFGDLWPGIYTMSEVLHQDYTSSVNCTSDVVSSGPTWVTVKVMPGVDITCTFTNTAKGTGLTIVKSVVGPAPASNWQFTSSALGNFSLPAAGGSKSFTDLPAGGYTVSETAVPGYKSSVTCVPGGESGSGSISVTLAPNQQKTCTFTNTAQLGTIKVIQQVKPAGTQGPAPWSFTGTLGTFQIDKSGGEKAFANKPAGSFTITQSNVDGFNQTVSCSTGESGKRSVTVVLDPNELITCTFRATKADPAPGSIVFSSNRDGDADIYMLDITVRNAQPVQLTDAPGDDTDPALSADGTQVAFTSMRDGNPEIYIMDYDGEFQTRMTQSLTIQRRPAWSPDGEQLAYESDESGNKDVFVMPVASRAPTRVTNDPADDGDPTWIPGPRLRIVYTSNRDGNQELYETEIGAPTQTRRLTNNPGVDYAPLGARRGQTPVVVYTCGRSSGGLIWAMCMARLPDSSRVSVDEPIVLTDAPGINYPLAWSLDYESIIFSSTRDGNAEIYSMTAEGEDETRLTNDPAGDGEADTDPLPLGDVTIRAIVVGPEPANDWQFSGDLGAFTLPAAGGSRTFTAQTAGSYWIMETATPGYVRTATCTGGVTGAGSVVLSLDPGLTVTCTFTHTAEGATTPYRLFAPVIGR